MYRDKSLLPIQAFRLATLGSLALGPKRYADLATELRQFSALVVGPSLDLLGSSIELLRVDGLIAAEDGEGAADNALLTLTEAGTAAFRQLMDAPLRAPMSDVTRLVILLKLRFVHLLAPAERQEQLEILIDLLEGEAARRAELEARFGAANPFIGRWLEAERADLEARAATLRQHCRRG